MKAIIETRSERWGTDRAVADLAEAIAAQPDDLIAALGSGPAGLTTAEAQARLARFGLNATPRRRGERRAGMLARNFTHLLALLLWAATALAVIAGLPQLAIAIIAVIAVNGVFAFLQEDHADRLLRALEEQAPLATLVRRDGQAQSLPARHLVPGDIVLLREGDRVPADARLIEAQGLQVDNSSLTGESEPLARHAAPAPPCLAIEAPNLVFAGTVVVTGEGQAIVYATGAGTELGRVVAEVAILRPVRSPLERQVDRVARTTAVVAVGVGLFVLLLALSLGDRSAEDALIFSVGVIVALTPEGLLPTVSLGLALGVTRIARRNGVVRRLSAVEALGSATVICTDKTGTLTMNRFSAVRHWTPGMAAPAPLPGEGMAYARLVEVGARASAAEMADGDLVGDPIDVALARLAPGGTRPEAPARAFPFDTDLRRATLLRRSDGGRLAAACKGAPESVLPLTIDTDNAARAAAEVMAAEGLRVIAIAEREVEGDPSGLDRAGVEKDLRLAGVIGFLDPPREGVPEAVERCQRAGIRVHVMSGDHASTARAVARSAGIRETAVVTGAELDAMSEAALRRALAGSVVFARVTPHHKLRIVEALQDAGEIVAVTGDGVNDAPALRRADVGVAMGGRGTEAARQAADIVLLDDNFATIVAAVEEGRAIFDNIRKFAAYVFTSNVAELAPFIAFILLDLPLAIPVLLVLAIDLGTDLLPALALAAEPPEPGVMTRPPRPPREPILSRATLARALLFLGVIEAALGMAFFLLRYAVDGWEVGDPLADSGPLYESAKAAAFLGIVGGQMGALFACRSALSPGLPMNPLRNRWLFVGLAWEAAVAGAIVFLPPVSHLFGVRNPGLVALLVPVAAFVLLLADDLRKVAAARLRAA